MAAGADFYGAHPCAEAEELCAVDVGSAPWLLLSPRSIASTGLSGARLPAVGSGSGGKREDVGAPSLFALLLPREASFTVFFFACASSFEGN